MKNRGKQAREDDSMALISSSTRNLELPVSASAGHLWYGWLGKRNQRRETLACVMPKSKLNCLSFLSSCNFPFSLNPGLLSIQVSIGQPVWAVQKHRERGCTFSEDERRAHWSVLHTHPRVVPNVSDKCCSSSSPRLAVQFIQKRRGRWPAQPCSQLLLHCWAWRGFQRHQLLPQQQMKTVFNKSPI